MSELGTVLRPLEGGHSGRTFLGEVAGERAVVRFYPPGDPRGDAAPEVDQAVLRLVRGCCPSRTSSRSGTRMPAGRPGLLVTSWLPGERGDLVVARLSAAGDADGLTRLGRASGRSPPRSRGCRCCDRGPSSTPS